jgi:baseplate hub protein gp41
MTLLNPNAEFLLSPYRKELFRRDWRIRIGLPFTDSSGVQRISGLDISELDCSFEIEKDLTGEPNKCSLKIMNLRPEVRGALETANIYDPKKPKGSTSAGKGTKSAKAVKKGNIRVEIEAGYKETARALIFRGDLRRAISTVEDDKSVTTTIEGEDGGRTTTSSRVTESFAPGTTRLIVVQKCLDALGIGRGNLVEVETQLSQVYSHGTVLDGPAAKELAGVLRAAKITYSIQDGAVQFLTVGKGRNKKAVLLDYASGLIGEPERDANGLVVVTSLLNPDLFVGCYVYLDSKDLKGTFLISKITYEGDTNGDAWFAKLELRAG